MGRTALRIPTPEQLKREPGDDQAIRDLIDTAWRNLEMVRLFEGTTLVAFTTHDLERSLRELNRWLDGAGHAVAVSASSLRDAVAVIAAIPDAPSGQPSADEFDLVQTRPVDAGVTRPLNRQFCSVSLAVPEQVGALATYSAQFAERGINITQLSTWVGAPAADGHPPACVLRFDLDLPAGQTLADVEDLVSTCVPNPLHVEVSPTPLPEPSRFRVRTGEAGVRLLNVIGPDRPGIVAMVSTEVAAAGLNIESSSQVVMAGHSVLTAVLSGDGAAENTLLAERIQSKRPELELVCATATSTDVEAPAGEGPKDLWWSQLELSADSDIIDVLIELAGAPDTELLRFAAYVSERDVSAMGQFAVGATTPPSGLLSALRRLGTSTPEFGDAPLDAWYDFPLL